MRNAEPPGARPSTQNTVFKPKRNGVFRQLQIKFKTVKFRTWIYKFDHAASNMQRRNSTAESTVGTQKFNQLHPAVVRGGKIGGKDKASRWRKSFQPYNGRWRHHNAIQLKEPKGSK
jgi:hypothetical protein